MDAKAIIDLKQKRASLTEEIHAILDRNTDVVINAADEQTVRNLEAEFDKVNARIVTEEKQLERERAAGEKQEKNPPQNDRNELTNAFKNYITSGTQHAYEVYNAIQQDNPTQAGYLVAPEQFVAELIKEMADATFMRQKAKVLPPLRGAQSLGYPQRTAAMSSFSWGTELSTPTADTTLAVGKREFKPRPGTSEILVSKTLIRNMSNADAFVRAEIAEDAGSGLETAYMTGNGVTCPLGVFVASSDGIPASRDVSTGNTATEIKFDGLIEAQYSVKDKFQSNCEWIFHRDALKQIRKLKNSDGQYIWQPSLVVGAPDLLLGKPINSSEYAPHTFTTGLYVGLYGDLNYYWICDSLLMEIQALFELYARSNQVDYITRLETDGAPVMPSAFARVKLA